MAGRPRGLAAQCAHPAGEADVVEERADAVAGVDVHEAVLDDDLVLCIARPRARAGDAAEDVRGGLGGEGPVDGAVEEGEVGGRDGEGGAAEGRAALVGKAGGREGDEMEDEEPQHCGLE